MSAVSAADAARTAVERLRTAQVQASQRQDASRAAVEQLRERNREESRQLVERAVAAGGQHLWPQDHHQPQEMHLYDTDDPEAPPAQPHPVAWPAAQRPPAAQPATQPPPPPPDDDWSEESWLH